MNSRRPRGMNRMITHGNRLHQKSQLKQFLKQSRCCPKHQKENPKIWQKPNKCGALMNKTKIYWTDFSKLKDFRKISHLPTKVMVYPPLLHLKILIPIAPRVMPTVPEDFLPS